MRDKSDRFNYERLSTDGWVPVEFRDLLEEDVIRLREKDGSVPVGYGGQSLVIMSEPHKVARVPVERKGLNGETLIQSAGVKVNVDDPNAVPNCPTYVETRQATKKDVDLASKRTEADRTQRAADRRELRRLKEKLEED